MVARVLQKASYKKLYYFAMCYAMKLPANPLANIDTLENLIAQRLVKGGSRDPEVPDNTFQAGLAILAALGMDKEDIDAWSTGAVVSGQLPNVGDYETVAQVGNAGGIESLGNNLDDVWNKLGSFDLIGAGQEVVDTFGDLFWDIFDG